MSDVLSADLTGLPEGLTARPLTLDDAGAAAGLLEAAEAVDDTGEHEDAADLAEWWGRELVDLPRDGRAVLTADGRLVAWATSISQRGGREALRVWSEGRVHPDQRGRGIGRALLDWQVRRGTEQHAQFAPPGLPGRLVTSVWPAMTSLERLVRRAGFEVERLFASMERPLDDVPTAVAPAGLELVPFTWDRDDEVRRAHNASFTEHHGSTERDETAWRTWFTGVRAFRPDLSVLALADGAVAGYALGYVYDADTRATGVTTVHLGQIGVLSAFRGRGVAGAAIAAALTAAAADGCRRAALDVDTENTTGAFALYERVGFRVARTHHSWAFPVPPVAG
ncbi:acetyltransferase (GNAT) family protein [Geodermatophilus normandii]|uniref:Acetyltransferase (GNAT) family protein n=1 Tax=Geodermatophilus normandii TaxID=1137989 RepID=A0A317QFJ1_9ACTN|nr:GNAT family N-acetyltransferase [Geodermatophilus normandii]PWW21085.1 acetyltransferase (GNAT) family protein [Geodermatophilus normandii]